MRLQRYGILGLALLLFTVSAAGQVPAPSGCADSNPSTYVLGPADQITITGLDVEEMANKPVRVDENGDISLPLVGRLHIAGLTVRQCELELNQHLSTYIREPQVAVSVTEQRSQPVSVIGAVNTPGIHEVEGRKTLLEMLSLAGGIRPDAGYSVKITRQREWGCIPLPNSTLDPSGRFSVAEVSLKKIMNATQPEENILVMPHDVISVPRAEMVYVIGDVKKSGGFALGEHQSVTVLQALSLAEGLERTAAPQRAKILRANPEAGQRIEIAVNVKKILEGKSKDVPLQGDDILFVPDNVAKNVAIRSLETIVGVGSGIAVWRAGTF